MGNFLGVISFNLDIKRCVNFLLIQQSSCVGFPREVLFRLLDFPVALPTSITVERRRRRANELLFGRRRWQPGQ